MILKSGQLFALLLAAILPLVAFNYATDIASPVSVYYSEGPTLDQAMRLTRGENIYRPDIDHAPFTINNYGPLYYLLQAPFLQTPTLFFGRIISAIAALSSACFASLIAHHLTRSRNASIITFLLVLAAPLAGAGMPLYRVDPLALSLSLAGLYIGLSATTRTGNLFAALLLAATIYTKLTYAIAAPATLFFFHFLNDRRKLAIFQALALALITATLLLLTQWLTHGGFLFNIVTANLLEYSPLRALDYFKIAYLQSAIATLAIPQLWQARNLPREPKLFCSLYLFFSCVSSLAAGKIGANYGYFGEFQIAAALMLGLVFTCRATMATWITIGQAILYGYFLFTSPYHHFLRENEKEMLELKQLIMQEPGIVLADDYMGTMVLAGKEIYFEPFEMTQLSRSGNWSQETLLQELRHKKYAMILMGEVPLRNERWTPEMLAAIDEGYVLTQHRALVDIWRPR